MGLIKTDEILMRILRLRSGTAHWIEQIDWRMKRNLLVIYSEIYSAFTFYRLGGTLCKG